MAQYILKSDMKANEAPEKIYFGTQQQNVNPFFGLTHKCADTDIEYTRTDAFIQKALKWYCLDCECNDNCRASGNCFFKAEYERYLKGSDNALPPKIEGAVNPDGSTSGNYRYRHFISKIKNDLIEKACQFIKEHHHEFSFWNTEEYELGFSTQKFIEDFKNFMKRE